MTELWKLSQRRIIRIHGEDAYQFLQGIVTNDVRKLAIRGDAVFAALLTPQGKLLCDFFVIHDRTDLLLDVHESHHQLLMQKLSMYKLRANVKIAPEPALQVYAGIMDTRNDNVLYYTDTRITDAPIRCITSSETVLQHNGTDIDYQQWRIKQGIPEAAQDAADGSYFPLELGYDRLHAIDFKKGCYVGQEVTARSHYRGNVRKTLFNIQGIHPLPASGTDIMAGEKRLGEMLSSFGSEGLALLRYEDTQAALQGNQRISANGEEVTVTLPRWRISEGDIASIQAIFPVTE